MKVLIYDPHISPKDMEEKTECLFIYEEDEEKTINISLKNTFPIYVSINPKNKYKDKDISIIKEKINENFSKLNDKIKENQYEYIGLPFQGFEIKSSPLVTRYFKQKIDELKQRLEKEEEEKKMKEEIISWNIS